MNMFTAVLSFLFTSIVMLVIIGIVRFTMEIVGQSLTIYYTDVYQLFFITMSFMTIFSLVAVALNKMGIGDKITGGRF